MKECPPSHKASEDKKQFFVSKTLLSGEEIFPFFEKIYNSYKKGVFDFDTMTKMSGSEQKRNCFDQFKESIWKGEIVLCPEVGLQRKKKRMLSMVSDIA